MSWWYLSFSGQSTGEHLGVAFIELPRGAAPVAAHARAKELARGFAGQTVQVMAIRLRDDDKMPSEHLRNKIVPLESVIEELGQPIPLEIVDGHIRPVRSN
jgi:hypothetical protein